MILTLLVVNGSVFLFTDIILKKNCSRVNVTSYTGRYVYMYVKVSSTCIIKWCQSVKVFHWLNSFIKLFQHYPRYWFFNTLDHQTLQPFSTVSDQVLSTGTVEPLWPHHQLDNDAPLSEIPLSFDTNLLTTFGFYQVDNLTLKVSD